MDKSVRRIIFSLPASLLQELDEYAVKHKYNRSEFLRHAIRKALQEDVQLIQQKT